MLAHRLLVVVVLELLYLGIAPAYSQESCGAHEYLASKEIRGNRLILHCKCEQGFDRYLGDCVPLSQTVHPNELACRRQYLSCGQSARENTNELIRSCLFPVDVCENNYIVGHSERIPPEVAAATVATLTKVRTAIKDAFMAGEAIMPAAEAAATEAVEAFPGAAAAGLAAYAVNLAMSAHNECSTQYAVRIGFCQHQAQSSQVTHARSCANQYQTCIHTGSE